MYAINGNVLFQHQWQDKVMLHGHPRSASDTENSVNEFKSSE
jgi:hypothetical protein